MPTPKIVATYFILIPDIIIITRVIIIIIIPALMWFCTTYKIPIGNNAHAIGTTTPNMNVFVFIFSFVKYPAKNIISPIFVSSDGCSWIGPTFIQRLAPPFSTPIPGIKTANRINIEKK